MTNLTQWILKESYSRSEALSKLHQFKELESSKLDKLGHDIEGLTEKNFDDEVASCEEEIKNMDVMTVFLAKEIIDLGGIVQIEEKIRRDYGGEFLLDFRVDPRIVAGCKIAWKGKMGDFSLKRKIEENQDEIRKIVLT